MLSIVITVLLVGELLLFMVYDFIKNRARRSGHFLIRLLAGGLGIGLILLEVLSDDATQTRYLTLDIMAAVELLLLYPCSFEKTGLSLLVGVLLLVAVIISVIFSLVLSPGSLSFRFERVFFSYLILLLLLSGYYAASISRRFSGIRMFFRNRRSLYSARTDAISAAPFLKDYSPLLRKQGKEKADDIAGLV